MAEYKYEGGKINIHVDPSLYKDEGEEMKTESKDVIGIRLSSSTTCLAYTQSKKKEENYFRTHFSNCQRYRTGRNKVFQEG